MEESLDFIIFFNLFLVGKEGGWVGGGGEWSNGLTVGCDNALKRGIIRPVISTDRSIIQEKSLVTRVAVRREQIAR